MLLISLSQLYKVRSFISATRASLAETLQAAKKEFKSHARLLAQCSSPLNVPSLIDLLKHTPVLLAQVKPRWCHKSTGGDRQISESQAEHQMSKEISQVAIAII